MNIFEKLLVYFEYPFVRYAFIAGALISLCSSLFGVTLVLRRFSSIGDGLSHTAFGAMAVASALRMTNETPLVLLITLIAAILLLRSSHNAKIKGDASVAMISVGALAIGYLLMNLFSTGSNISGDVCGALFGSTSILTLKQSEVRLCVILSVAAIAAFVVFYNKIFSVSFDENFAKATGIKTDVYNLILAIVTAVIIVLAMNLVGSLLISALLIFPAISSMRVFKTFKSATICSAAISCVCAITGIAAAILLGTPVGATIVAVDISGFLIFSIIGAVGVNK